MLFDRLMKRTSFQTRLLFGLVLWTGITLCGVVSTHAQTRAIKPVRIEAKTAQNETVSYIYAESHALVIGVSQYRNGWSNLPGVQEDVEELSSALADNGFAVTVVEDPTLEEMEIAIEDFIFEKGANPDNRLLIYYAGHGHTMTLGYGGEMGYLVPADAPLPKKGRNTAFQRSVMSMQQVEVFAKNTSAKHVLFMFDACFAGSVFLATRAAPAYIQVYTKEPVRQFITSGSAEQEVPDKSIFRRAFVDALNGKADYDKDGYLTGSELGSYIQKRTAEDWKGNLTPQYGKLQDPNLNKGDFVFELSKPEVVKPPPAEPAPVVPPEPQQDYANLAWQLIKDLEDPKAFEEFIKMFPEAPQSNLAKLKLIALASSAPQKAEESMAPPVVTEAVSPPVVTDNVVFEKQASTSVVEEPIPPKEAAKTQLLQTKECIGCDLRGTDLSGTTLRAANLSGANLSGATLEGAYLVRADLSDANLQGTNLRDASLRKADISGTDIAKAFLCNTFMPDGSINNRDCEKTEQSSSEPKPNEFLSGEAAKKKLLETKECVGCNLDKVDLGEADLRGADLRNVSLIKAYLWKTNLEEANLERAYLNYANLDLATLEGANLKNTNLENARLSETKLNNANLENSSVQGAILEKASLYKANLTSANFQGANLKDANLAQARWGNANFAGAKFCNTMMPYSKRENSGCDRNSSKESSSPPEKTDQQIIRRGMDYSTYQAVEQNSSDVIGCGFFHVGCEEKALTFPAYQPDFHIKGYRRVNLWGKDRPWTDTEVYVKDGEIVYIFGTGAVKTCPSCLTEKLDRYTPLLTYKTGDRPPANIARFAGVQTNSQGYFSKAKIWAKDNTWSKDKFYLTIRDGDLSAASNSNYDDNSGIYILDIFVIDPDQEEGFNRFKDALFEANPNDANVKAYLGR